jgi:hypothetical protein
LGLNAGFFPAEMVPKTACVLDAAMAGGNPTAPAGGEPNYPQTPWGGTSFAQVMIVSSPAGIDIRYYNLTKAACISLATSSLPPDILIENISFTAVNLPPVGTGTLFTTSQITAACSLADGSNFVAAVYPLH